MAQAGQSEVFGEKAELHPKKLASHRAPKKTNTHLQLAFTPTEHVEYVEPCRVYISLNFYDKYNSLCIIYSTPFQIE